MAHQPSPHQDAAAAAEASLLMQHENAYLKQRVVLLNIRIRELTEELEGLRSEPDTEEAASC